MFKLDCKACGLCCTPLHNQDVFCNVTKADLERFDQQWIRRNVKFFTTVDWVAMAFSGDNLAVAVIRTKPLLAKCGPLNGFETNVCFALRGTLMYRVSCSIYSRRPRVCRDIVTCGDQACLSVRKMFKEFLVRMKP